MATEIPSPPARDRGWRLPAGSRSLPEVHGSIAVPSGAGFWKKMFAFAGPGYLMAILLQALAARLGIASGRDLAQACRDSYSWPTTIALWIICEIAIAACDLAEVIGAAIALNLRFGLPLVWGVCLTA